MKHRVSYVTMSAAHLVTCFLIYIYFPHFSNSFFVRYDAGDIYELMQKEGNWRTVAPQKPKCDEIYNFLPKMMIIEPDKVLWPFDVGTDVVKPFLIKGYENTTQRPKNKNRIWNEELSIEFRELTDHNGTLLTMHKDSAKLIVYMIKKGIKVAVAETTREIIIMRHLLHLFDIDHLFDFMELDTESAIDHVKTIKEESGFDYHELIYFGANKSVLNEIKTALNMTTIYVNPESGINIKHVYQAIYIYNIKPYTQMVDDKPEYLGNIVSEEDAQRNMLILSKDDKIVKQIKPLHTNSQRVAPLSFDITKHTTTKVLVDSPKEEKTEKPTNKVRRPRTRTKSLKQKNTSKKYETDVPHRSEVKPKRTNVVYSNTESKRKSMKICKKKTTFIPTLQEFRATESNIGSGGKQKRLKTTHPKINSKIKPKSKQKNKNKSKQANQNITK